LLPNPGRPDRRRRYKLLKQLNPCRISRKERPAALFVLVFYQTAQSHILLIGLTLLLIYQSPKLVPVVV